MTFPFPTFCPVSGALSYVYNGNFSETAAAQTTISSVDFGVAAPGRIVVICVATVGVPARTISSATIGGVAATVDNATGTNLSTHMVWAVVPTGASGNVVLNFDGAPVRTARITSYSIYGAKSSTPNATGSKSSGGNGSRTSSGTTTEPSVIIAVSAGDQGAGSAVWSGSVSQDYKFIDGYDSFSSASAQQVEEGSFTASYSYCRSVMSFAWS